MKSQQEQIQLDDFDPSFFTKELIDTIIFEGATVVYDNMRAQARGDAVYSFPNSENCFSVLTSSQFNVMEIFSHLFYNKFGRNGFNLLTAHKTRPSTTKDAITAFFQEDYVYNICRSLTEFSLDVDPVPILNDVNRSFPLSFCSRPLSSISKKAYGVVLAASMPHVAYGGRFHFPFRVIFISMDKIPDDLDQLIDLSSGIRKRLNSTEEIFLRACPRVPRHGIIDSVRAKCSFSDTIPLARKIFNLKQDMLKNSENTGILFMPFYESPYSAVSSKKTTVYGVGHDGVTAGTGNSITLNHGHDDTTSGIKNIINQVADDGNAELEFIYANKSSGYSGTPTLVQIRNAPPLQSGVSSIPDSYPGFTNTNARKLMDYEIYNVSGTDLSAVEQIPEKHNVLIIHRDGSALSHAAAWARQKGVAFMAIPSSVELHEHMKHYVCEVAPYCVVFSKTVEKKVLTTPASSLKKLFFNTLDGCLGETEFTIEDVKEGAFLAFAFHHYSTEMTVTEQTAIMSAYFCASILRMTVMACCGEMRHFSSQGGVLDTKVRRIAVKILTGKSPMKGAISRESVYASQIGRSFFPMPKTIHGMRAVESIFGFGWGGSYGGPRWAKIAKYCVDCLEYARERELEEFLSTFNMLVNLVHNNGWYLNKFLHEKTLDTAHVFPLPVRSVELAIRYSEKLKKYRKGTTKKKYARQMFTASPQALTFAELLPVLTKDALIERLSALPKGILRAGGIHTSDPAAIKTVLSMKSSLQVPYSAKHTPKQEIQYNEENQDKVQQAVDIYFQYFQPATGKWLLNSYDAPSIKNNPVFDSSPPKPVLFQKPSKFDMVNPVTKKSSYDPQWHSMIDDFLGQYEQMPADFADQPKYVAKILWHHVGMFTSNMNDVTFQPCDDCHQYHSYHIAPKFLCGHSEEKIKKLLYEIQEAYEEHFEGDESLKDQKHWELWKTKLIYM